MKTMILKSKHRGKTVSVLTQKIENEWKIIDIDGYAPENYPNKVGTSAIEKINKKSNIQIGQFDDYYYRHNY